LELPAEVSNGFRSSTHVHVIPPSRRCPSNALPFLSIAKKVRQLKSGVWPWVVSTKEDAVVTLFAILDVSKRSCNPGEEIAFKL
jgi:hypothetical protein